ncbi:hypothetical protein H0H93_015533 [Arthromyces matolae]|nr:hypothetical protein H0H93_015533 [Arthromyces matolae]
MDLEVNGYDAQIHTNVIGHFMFTQLLLPALLSTAQADKTIKPRIITLSSSAHYFAGVNPLDFNTFKCSAARRKRTTQQMYIQSKFANLVYSNELARRYGNQGLVCIAVNPGNIKTSLDRHIDTIFDRLSIKALQIYPVELGAISQLWAGTSPEAAKLNGKFVIPWANIGTPRKETLDVSLGGDLWDWLDEQVKEFIN